MGNDLALGSALDGVVADRVGCPHGFLDVALVQVMPVIVRPDTGVIIRLQFQPDRVLVVIWLANFRQL